MPLCDFFNSSATWEATFHLWGFTQRVLYFHVSEQWQGCQHLGFFNEYTGVNELDCPWGLYKHLKRVCTESKPSAKNPLLHQGVKPGTVPCLTDAQSIELHPCTAELNKWTVHSWRDGGAEQEHSLLKAMLSTNVCGHHTDVWTLCARLCAYPESFLESKYSVQTLQL